MEEKNAFRVIVIFNDGNYSEVFTDHVEYGESVIRITDTDGWHHRYPYQGVREVRYKS